MYLLKRPSGLEMAVLLSLSQLATRTGAVSTDGLCCSGAELAGCVSKEMYKLCFCSQKSLKAA